MIHGTVYWNPLKTSVWWSCCSSPDLLYVGPVYLCVCSPIVVCLSLFVHLAAYNCVWLVRVVRRRWVCGQFHWSVITVANACRLSGPVLRCVSACDDNMHIEIKCDDTVHQFVIQLFTLQIFQFCDISSTPGEFDLVLVGLFMQVVCS